MPETVTDLLVRYRADVSDLQGKVTAIETALKKSGTAGEEAGKKIKKGLDDAQPSANSLGLAFEGLGNKIVAAFTVGAIIAFGRESIRAFEDAEKAAVKLRTAVSVSGGLGKDFDKLVAQSKELEKISIFSDDNIQAAQTMALQFGLTSDQVSELLPKVADFASATGQDLNTALQAVLSGVNGVGRGLKQYGITLNEGATATENLDRISLRLTQKYADQAKIVGDTAFGAHQKLTNELNNQQEVIGEKLIPIYTTLLSTFNDIISGAAILTSAASDLTNSDTSILNPANWFKATGAADEFNKKFKETFDLTLKASADENTAKIQLEINGLLKEQATLTGDSRTNALATIAALQQILRERTASNAQAKDEFKTASQLKQLTDQQLKAERELANSKSGTAAQTELQLIDREIKARKEAAEQEKKNQEERKKNLDQFSQDKKDADKTALDLNLADLDIQKQNEIGAEERSAQEKLIIDIKYLERKKAFFKAGSVEEAAINVDIATANTKLNDQKLQDAKTQAENETKIKKEAADKGEKITEDEEARKKQIKDAAIQSSAQALSDFINFSIEASRRNTDEQLNNVQSRLALELAAIDEEQAKAEGTFKNKTATEVKFENQRKALRDKAAAEEKKLKTEQAKKDKDAAIIQSIINTAVQVTKVIANPVLAAIVAALGLVETSLIIAQPIPQFAKGTKGAKGGLSMVGEQGTELMYVPPQAKILSNEKTNRYGHLIDAMYDDRIDNYILNKYVAPALRQQQNMNSSFAQNVTNSIDTKALASDIAFAMRRSGKVELSDENMETLGKTIAKYVPRYDPYKR